jgi:hypothetical protein
MIFKRHHILSAVALCASSWASGLARAQDGSALPPASTAETAAPVTVDAASVESVPAPAEPVSEANSPAPVPMLTSAPAPEPAASAPAQATTADASAAEMEAFLNQNLAEQNKPPKLEFYGFADFAYRQWLVQPGNKWRPFFPEKGAPQLIAGNFNLYLKGNLADSWTSLAEVRFHFAPAGDQMPLEKTVLDPTASGYADNTARDPVEYGREFDYGFIQIYRLHVDYSPYPLLNIRAGRFLTPYGVWNVDHGSPVQIDVTKPYIIGDALFPEAQTGFEIYGSTGVNKLDLGYHVTLSNGRGPIEQVGDLDRNKAIGGRIWLRANTPVEVTWGASAYTGKYTDKRFVLTDLNTQTTAWVSWERYKELGLATDLRLRYRGLTSVTEVIGQQRVWDDDARGIPASGTRTTAASRSADSLRWGVYSLLGYRFDWYGVMPFGIIQYYETGLRDTFAGASSLVTFGAGLNVRLVPAVVLKGSFNGVFLQNAEKGSPASDPLWLASSQIAWAF